MTPASIAILSFSMSADACAAAMARGAATRPTFPAALRNGLVFGVIEALTPLLGWAVGLAASAYIAAVDHWVAFVLLSATLLTGVLFVEDLLAQHLWHKTVLSVLSWLVLGALLLGRWRYGWRGGRAIRLVLVSMALLALAFFGTQFVLQMVLHRT